MSAIKLYETERLVYFEAGVFRKCRYYVLRISGPSPLPVKYRVRKKHVPVAIALFKDHPKGIQEIKELDMRAFPGGFWYPQGALEHNADVEADEDEE